MRFGVSLPNVGEPARLVELAVTVERAGWDGFFLWDHLQLDATLQPDVCDPWVVLGAVAASTSRVRLGAMVTPVARRRPWQLAKEITTLDHLSGGRVIVGVGLGEPKQADFGAFGEPTAARDRAERLDEALPLLDSFLRGDRVDHDGPHYTVHARLRPAAVQRPRPPIWVAATLPHRRPVARARRYEGVFPLSATSGAPTPDELAGLVASMAPAPGYDVVGILTAGATAPRLAAAGATWAIEGPAGPDEPAEALLARIEAGPPAVS